MKRVASVFVFWIAAGSAWAASPRPEITSFQSKERITHLAPGGANAAREIDLTVRLFDEAGRIVRMPGVTVDLSTRDAGPGNGFNTIVGRLTGVTGADGAFSGRLTFSDCRSPYIQGPISVHRISNRPEYWDVTYVKAAIFAGEKKLVEFVHVCKEIFRGSRP
jgi:hypothetical protein